MIWSGDIRGEAWTNFASRRFIFVLLWNHDAFGAATPGCLIAAFPALPRERQYRFVGGDLVLVDIDARLIIDILPLALVVN